MEYFLGLLWVIVAALLGKGGMMRREKVLGREERRATWIYALIVMGPLILLAGMRTIYFGDTYMYVRGFLGLPDTLNETISYIQSVKKDTAFYAAGAMLHLLVGDHARVYLLVIAAIQGLLIAKTYRKYSEDYWFAIFVFVATTDYLSWMYNGIRQFVAVAITFSAAGLIFRRRYVRAAIVIAFASLFHQSALLMIPIMFIVQGRPWNWKTLLVIAGTLLAMRFSGIFTSALDTMLEETQYQNVVSDWQRWQDDGTNPLRVLVYSVPTILSLFCRKRIQKSGDRAVQVACNMGIVSTALYMISMVTSGIFMGRLPIYCSLYANGILLPWELKHCFGKPLRSLALVCYAAFFCAQLMLGW